MLKVNKLSKFYKEKTVLDNVSFNIPDGKVCAVLGLNGAGKSTLMKIICNLAFADSGYIEFDGRRITDNSDGNIGFMIETPRFYRELTGRQNLTALAYLYDNIQSKRIDEVLSVVGLDAQADIAVKKYSLGMKQRLYFAYAIINKPKLLILDEPFSGIDPITVRLFQKLIIDFAAHGCTVLVSSHVISDVQSISDYVVIIDNGKLVYESENIINEDITQIFLSMVDLNGKAQ
jgi:ABC-2 type transport system ATP-binding protein